MRDNPSSIAKKEAGSRAGQRHTGSAGGSCRSRGRATCLGHTKHCRDAASRGCKPSSCTGAAHSIVKLRVPGTHHHRRDRMQPQQQLQPNDSS